MKIIILVLSITLWSCLNSASKEKELSLKEREIELKEKELTLKFKTDSLDRLKNNQESNKAESFDLSNLEKNYIYAYNKMFTIRVDLLKNNSIRYAAWDNSKNLNSISPSLVILDGEVERQGTMGGYTYTFNNKEFKYIVDQRNMAESEEGFGIFLSIYQNETLIYSSKMKEK